MLLLRLTASLWLVLALSIPAQGAESAERTYLFALKAYRDGLYETSAEAFRAYLALPTSKARRAEANLFLGQALLALGRDTEALDALETAARADAKARVAPLARLLRARRYLELTRYEEAEDEASRWLRYFPGHSLRWEVRLLRGRALAGLKRWNEAAALFQEVADAKQSPVALYREALLKLAAVRDLQGRADEAIAAWGAVLQRAPADPRAAEARLQLAAHAAKGKRYDEALDHLETLLTAFPNAPEAGPARVLRAESLFGLERWAEAAEAYREAASAAGAEVFGQAHWERAGLAAFRVGRFQQASDALARAGDGPDGATLAVRLQALQALDQPVESLKAAARLVATYPRSPWAADAIWATVALARTTGRWDDARGALSAYVGRAPAGKQVEARYALAHVELDGGRPAEAARLFEAVSQAEGGLDRYGDVRYKRAVALATAGRQEAALELVEALSDRERAAVGAASVLALEADVHRALGHYGVAADRYQALLAQGPEADGASRWLLALAEVEEARGRSREALGAYQEWLASHADDPAASTVRLAAARLLVAVGRRDEAWASLEAIAAGDDPHLAAQAFLLQGRIAFEERDYEAAVDAAAKAADGVPPEHPAHALARWRMARALEEMGRSTDATTHYRWLAEHAEEAEVRHASQERLARMMAKANEAKTP